MSVPEILTIPDLFNATVNANAVRWVRDYIDQLDMHVAACRKRHKDDDGECSTCVERGHIAREIRALLPAMSTEDPSP